MSKLKKLDIPEKTFNDNLEILFNVLNFENGRRYKFICKKQHIDKDLYTKSSSDLMIRKSRDLLKSDILGKKSNNLKQDLKSKKFSSNGGTSSARIEDNQNIIEESSKKKINYLEKKNLNLLIKSYYSKNS